MSFQESPLPLYNCHKQVKAAKITAIRHRNYHVVLELDFRHTDSPSECVDIPNDWFNKHNPNVGGYLVLYTDGYMSYSPAQAFEDGYSLNTPIRITQEQHLSPGELVKLAKEQQPILIPSNNLADKLRELAEDEAFIEDVCRTKRHDFGPIYEKDMDRIKATSKEWINAIIKNLEYHTN